MAVEATVCEAMRRRLATERKDIKIFSDKEVEYIKSQRIARIATLSTKHQPDVAPVGFEFDGQYFFVGGLQQEKTNKYKNVVAGNIKVALVIDDMESLSPPKPRGLKIHGLAEIEERQGQTGFGQYLKVKAQKYWSLGNRGSGVPGWQDRDEETKD